MRLNSEIAADLRAQAATVRMRNLMDSAKLMEEAAERIEHLSEAVNDLATSSSIEITKPVAEIEADEAYARATERFTPEAAE